jgi:hypothetical protein
MKKSLKLTVLFLLFVVINLQATPTFEEALSMRTPLIERAEKDIEYLVGNSDGNTEELLKSAEQYWNGYIGNRTVESIVRVTKYYFRAIELDSTYEKAYYRIANIFYSDFIKPRIKNKQSWLTQDYYGKQCLADSPEQALKYFYLLWDISSDYHELIFCPIRQLENFLKIENSPIQCELSDIRPIDCRPGWVYMNLKENWESDYTLDFTYLEFLYYSGRYSDFLEKIEEPCLYTMEIQDSSSAVYRMCFWRANHPTIYIRLEHNSEKTRMYWKTVETYYDSTKVLKSGSKKLSKRKWKKFVQKVDESGYNDLPMTLPEGYFSSITLERKDLNGYRTSSEFLMSPCKYMIWTSPYWYLIIEDFFRGLPYIFAGN